MNEDEQIIWGQPVSFQDFVQGLQIAPSQRRVELVPKADPQKFYIREGVASPSQDQGEIRDVNKERLNRSLSRYASNNFLLSTSNIRPDQNGRYNPGLGQFAGDQTALVMSMGFDPFNASNYYKVATQIPRFRNWGFTRLLADELNNEVRVASDLGKNVGSITVTPVFESFTIPYNQPYQLFPKTSLKFFERSQSKLSEAERVGVPRGERNIRQHGSPKAPYYDYSLLNRSYEPWIINEKGQFVFDSPDKAKKLSTIHFSLNEPVRSHIQGSWDDAPTVTILPYRNMRSQAAPADVAIMDVFFPNYKGLKVSSRGSKTLTGDRTTFDYYKSHGVDVEFSSELESLRKELEIIKKRLEEIPPEERYKVEAWDVPDYVRDLYKRQEEITDEMDRIVRDWSKKNTKYIPSFEKLNEFGKAEGFDMDNYPYWFGTPIRDNDRMGKLSLDYEWVSDPSNHAGAVQQPKVALKSALEYNARPEYIEWLKWLINHQADYRKRGGKIIQKFKNRNK